MLQTEYDGTTRLAKELLPKVLITDPAIQAIKELEESKIRTSQGGNKQSCKNYQI